MKHSQDKGSDVHRALSGIEGHEASQAAAARLRELGDRVHRDRTLEIEATRLYEEDLRFLSKAELAKRAGWSGARQAMIADIIMHEVHSA